MIETWIAQVRADELGDKLRAQIALIEAGHGAVASLLDLLRDANEETRWRAALMMGAIRDRAALPMLVDAMHDPVLEVREAAGWALGRLGDAAAFDALLAYMQVTTPEEQAPYVAALALVEIDVVRAEAVLRESLASPHEATRRIAMSAFAVLRANP